jgi:hypothetical protein
MPDGERPILFDMEALIASLHGDERIEAAREALALAEKAAMENIANLMLHSTKPVDQRKVDFTRGYYAGARYWLGARMTDAQTRIALMANQTPEEDDA